MAARNRWVRIGLSALIAALLYLPGLGSPALWEPDEGRYAEIAREMVVSGDYITPRDNFIRYFEKPPLGYWAEAATMHVFGSTEFSARFPAAVFTIAEVATTCAIGEAMFGASAGLYGAMVLALSPLVFAFARFATLDPALAFFLTVAIGAFYFASESGDFASGRGRLWMIISAAMLALGTLVKGPVALILGGGIALAWLLIERRGREVPRMPLLICGVVYLTIAIPWFLLAEHRNPGFLRFFFMHEHVQRFVSSSEHGWGPYFFIPVVIGGMWPWLFFVPTGITEARSEANSMSDKTGAALRLLITWFAIIFVFFSIPRSKLGSYILPALPPLAIVCGLALSRLGSMEVRRRVRLVGWFAVINSIMAVIGVTVLVAMSRRIGFTLMRDGVEIAILIAASAIAAWFLVMKTGTASYALGAIAIGMAATVWIGEQARSHVSAITSYRSLARQIEPYRGCALASYRHFVQSLPFYTGQREILVQYRGELAPFAQSPDERAGFVGTQRRLQELWSSEQCLLVIANRKDFNELSGLLTPAPRIVGCEGKKLALYNRDAPKTEDCTSEPDPKVDMTGADR